MNLKERRAQKKMSQQRLSELTGLSQGIISLYETGKAEIPEENALLLENALEGNTEDNIDAVIHNQPFSPEEHEAIGQFGAWCMGQLGVERAAKMIAGMNRAQLRAMSAATGFLETPLETPDEREKRKK